MHYTPPPPPAPSHQQQAAHDLGGYDEAVRAEDLYYESLASQYLEPRYGGSYF